ncbi:MAG: hypothetical protein IKN17_04085 [Ruminococcus sp.]|nr:hypothetical protein [Ruminococcus sp.]
MAVCAAIGGINKYNIRTLFEAEPDGYAAVSAVFGQEDIETAARELRQIISLSTGQKGERHA